MVYDENMSGHVYDVIQTYSPRTGAANFRGQHFDDFIALYTFLVNVINIHDFRIVIFYQSRKIKADIE